MDEATSQGDGGMKRFWIAAAVVGLLGLGAAAVLKRRCGGCTLPGKEGTAAVQSPTQEAGGSPFDRAVRFQDAGKHAEAIPLYREVLQKSPGDPDARFNLGTALEATGKPEEALEAYLEILKRDPSSAEAALAAAETADALGRDDLALDLYHAHMAIVMRTAAPVRRRIETLERGDPIDDLLDEVLDGE